LNKFNEISFRGAPWNLLNFLWLSGIRYVGHTLMEAWLSKILNSSMQLSSRNGSGFWGGNGCSLEAGYYGEIWLYGGWVDDQNPHWAIWSWFVEVYPAWIEYFR
jgi:hypothetical protein